MIPKDVSIGDEIEIESDKGEFKGRYIESADKDFIVLKLDSGYNIGIERKKVKAVKLLKKFSKRPVPREKAEEKEGLKTISVLHTGGTISSAVDYSTGGVTPHFSPEELIAMFPEVKGIANIRSRLVRNMASDDMRFGHYNILAAEIERELKMGTDGVIITHGTDTMHYTSAALSFILEDLPIPVILVGAQRSSDRGSSDAAMNFICACLFIARTEFSGVAICMHKGMDDEVCSIIHGCKARKMHTSRRDAFKGINAINIAEVDYLKQSVKLEPSYGKKGGKLAVKPIKENLKIGMVYAHPQMFASELAPYADFDGLVLIGTGLGHFPISKIDELTAEHVKILKAIEGLAKKMPVVMSPQTIYGRIQMNVYGGGREIQKAGVIGNYSDMTPETTFVKLAWLLSNHPNDVRKMMAEDLRGEISKRIVA